MEIVQYVIPISDEWRSDLLVTVPKKLRSIKKKKKATKRNVRTKNWVTIGGSTLEIVRWY